MRLQISEVDNQPDTVLARVEGVVDSTTLEEFFSNLSGVFIRELKNLLLDMSRMSYISSGGFSVLQDAYKKAEARGGTVRIVGASEQVEELFGVVGFQRLFAFYEDLDAALQTLKAADAPGGSG